MEGCWGVAEGMHGRVLSVAEGMHGRVLGCS